MRSRPLVILALLLLAIPMFGRIGTIDVVPSATILFPYFEVDPVNPNGMNTVLSVQNASAIAILLNVTLWTDWGIPTQSFPVYLTGYDQETIDLFALFNGSAPRTASNGTSQDPLDTISPKGLISQDINFASCSGILPDLLIPSELAAAHRGEASEEFFSGNCGGRDYGDSIARGFVTIDTTVACTNLNPSEPGYFNAEDFKSIGSFQNAVLGDYVILDRATGRAQAETAVHIEASTTDPLVNTSGNQTFYGRFLGNNSIDRREPLPSAWAGSIMSGRTAIDTYRDPGAPVSPVPCGMTPPQFPLTQQTVTVYDSTGASSAVAPGDYFPRSAGQTAVGAGGLPATPKIGWIFLDLDTGAGVTRQSWVTFRHLPEELPATTPFGTAVPGIQMPQP